MVRKQLYFPPHLDQAVKRRAAQQGISEAELVRRAIEQALHDAPRDATLGNPRALQALERLKTRAVQTRTRVNVPGDWHFDRDETHDRPQKEITLARRSEQDS
jgi:hypothetical protein